MTRIPKLAHLSAAVFVSGLAAPAVAAEAITLPVDCSRGQSIAQTLKFIDPARRPLVLVVKGTCNENVMIDREDVTLHGDPKVGGVVNGPNSAMPTISVNAARVVIDHLTVTGGGHGIQVQGLWSMNITNSHVRNTAQSGVFLRFGHARMVNNTIEYAGRHGVELTEGSAALLSNSAIQHNTIAGVHAEGASALTAVGNTINSNGSNGVELRGNSQASLNGNTVSGNGFSPPPGEQRNGVHARYSKLGIDGGRIIGNAGTGVGLFGAVGEVLNVEISGNTGAGLAAAFGSTVDFGGSTVTGNGAQGVNVHMSTARIGNAVITNNVQADAVLIRLGSKLTVSNTEASGNGGYGLQCWDGESSYEGTINGMISPSCTGF